MVFCLWLSMLPRHAVYASRSSIFDWECIKKLAATFISHFIWRTRSNKADEEATDVLLPRQVFCVTLCGWVWWWNRNWEGYVVSAWHVCDKTHQRKWVSITRRNTAPSLKMKTNEMVMIEVVQVVHVNHRENCILNWNCPVTRGESHMKYFLLADVEGLGF